MSWDKQTINLSDLDARIDLLRDLGVDFELKVLGEVPDMGNNYTMEASPNIKIRLLRYKNKVYIEQMSRTYDCDSDDLIVCHDFIKGSEPSEWALEVYNDFQHYVDHNGETVNYKDNIVKIR